jgi:energy-converting hydrogenase Eha subunit E
VSNFDDGPTPTGAQPATGAVGADSPTPGPAAGAAAAAEPVTAAASEPSALRTPAGRCDLMRTFALVIAAGVWATLALDWWQFTMPAQVLNLPVPGGGTEPVQLNGASATLIGRDAAAASTVAVVAGYAAVVALAAHRRWWVLSAAVAVIGTPTGRFAPSTTPPDVVAAANSASAEWTTPGLGVTVIFAAYVATFALALAVTVQAFIVRRAERRRAAIADGYDSPVQSIVDRYITASLRRVGIGGDQSSRNRDDAL